MFKNLLKRIRNPAWQDFVLLTAALALFGGLFVFAQVAEEVLEGENQETENELMRALRSPEDPSMPIGPEWLMQAGLDITALGSGAVLTLTTLLVAGYLLLAKRYAHVLFLLVATLGGTFLSLSLKAVFSRERPSVVPHLANVTSASFPSGHSMVSSVVYLTLGVMLSRSVKSKRAKIYYVSAAMFLAFLIGLSRVYLGVHYPTDVVAGWAVGTAWATICSLVAYWLQSRGDVEPPGGSSEEQAEPQASS